MLQETFLLSKPANQGVELKTPGEVAAFELATPFLSVEAFELAVFQTIRKVTLQLKHPKKIEIV